MRLAESEISLVRRLSESLCNVALQCYYVETSLAKSILEYSKQTCKKYPIIPTK